MLGPYQKACRQLHWPRRISGFNAVGEGTGSWLGFLLSAAFVYCLWEEIKVGFHIYIADFFSTTYPNPLHVDTPPTTYFEILHPHLG